MNTDIRLAVSFKGHRKRKKLERILPGSTIYLIDLWISAAISRPEGDLTGWDEEDIAIECGWEGDPKELVSALVTAGWIDNKNGVFYLHDWEEHQGWACKARKRSEDGKKGAEARWEKKRQQRIDPEPKANGEQKGCGGNAGAMRGQCGGNAGNQKPQCPFPTPTPTPTPDPSPF